MRARAAVAGLVALLAVAVPAAPASAHGREGRIDLTGVREVAPLELVVEARVWYEDCDGADGARVRMVLERPDDPAPPPPTRLRHVDGNRFRGRVVLGGPSRWTLRVTSRTPVASARASVDVDGTAAPASLVDAPQARSCGASRRTVLLGVGGAILLAGVAVEVVSRRRRRRRRGHGGG